MGRRCQTRGRTVRGRQPWAAAVQSMRRGPPPPPPRLCPPTEGRVLTCPAGDADRAKRGVPEAVRPPEGSDQGQLPAAPRSASYRPADGAVPLHPGKGKGDTGSHSISRWRRFDLVSTSAPAGPDAAGQGPDHDHQRGRLQDAVLGRQGPPVRAQQLTEPPPAGHPDPKAAVGVPAADPPEAERVGGGGGSKGKQGCLAALQWKRREHGGFGRPNPDAPRVARSLGSV